MLIVDHLLLHQLVILLVVDFRHLRLFYLILLLLQGVTHARTRSTTVMWRIGLMIHATSHRWRRVRIIIAIFKGFVARISGRMSVVVLLVARWLLLIIVALLWLCLCLCLCLLWCVSRKFTLFCHAIASMLIRVSSAIRPIWSARLMSGLGLGLILGRDRSLFFFGKWLRKGDWNG